MTKRRNYYGFIDTLKKDDKCLPKYKQQLKERGFDDTETWSLFTGISRFVLPRLKRYKEITIAFPYGLTEKEWDDILDKMIAAFELLASDKMTSSKEDKIITAGTKLFEKWFRALWW